MRGDGRAAARKANQAVEGERRDVGQALHDTVCQSLGGIAILVKLLVRRAKAGHVVAAADLEELGCMTDRALEEARALSRRLLPVQLESAGLMSALEELAAETSRTVPCTFLCDPPVFVGDAAAALALYRRAEEAVRWATGKGSSIPLLIVLTERDGEARLEVRDGAPAAAPRSPARSRARS